MSNLFLSQLVVLDKTMAPRDERSVHLLPDLCNRCSRRRAARENNTSEHAHGDVMHGAMTSSSFSRQSCRMRATKVMTSWLLLLVGVVVGVVVNYHGLMFDAIHVQLQVTID